uniref:Exophilin 5 n=1 Tax=Panagrolaimus sp. PS1159 TaxID=55785 RepID=A0AC35F682_9BILA
MATKGNCSFSKQSFSSDISHTDNDNQYSNLNLNLKCGSPAFIPVHSSSKLSNEKRSAFDNYEEKGQSQSWNKSFKSCLNTVKLNDLAENEAKKDSKKDNFSKITNKSTLSLHISACENSSEVVATNLFDNKNVECLKQKSLIEKQGNEKKTFAVSTFFIQNPFEFQRQENTKAKEPEVSQFKLSQRLLSPNKASGMSRYHL